MTEKYSPQKHEFGTDAAAEYAKSITPGQGKKDKEKKKMKTFLEHLDVLDEVKMKVFGNYVLATWTDKKGGGFEVVFKGTKEKRDELFKKNKLKKNRENKDWLMWQSNTKKRGDFISGERKESFDMEEATYQGKEVPLNKPMPGDVKKSKVFVKDGGKVKKVNFGDKSMSIKKDQKGNKKSYCARSAGIKGGGTDKTKANYWSRKAWDC